MNQIRASSPPPSSCSPVMSREEESNGNWAVTHSEGESREVSSIFPSRQLPPTTPHVCLRFMHVWTPSCLKPEVCLFLVWRLSSPWFFEGICSFYPTIIFYILLFPRLLWCLFHCSFFCFYPRCCCFLYITPQTGGTH